MHPSKDDKTANRTDLASRVFSNKAFELGWLIFLAVLVTFVTFPIQRVLLVWWAYGKDAYYQQGIRVIPRKPLRFSDGVLVPQTLEIITGAGMFLVTFFALTLGLFYGLRLYEHYLRRNKNSAAD
ncbi:MAG TPA: hypothetical protein VJP02_29805 [Candidatus Sulfotelmatobacter sp.]|nr:hypothetical protein [Candidatus Sulfotelmatobacter sp.]